MKHFLLLLIFAATVARAGAGATADELLENLKREIRAESDGGQVGKEDPQQHFQWQQMLSQLSQYTATESRTSELIRIVEEIEANTHSKKLGTLCHALMEQLRKERENQEKALLADIQKELPEAMRVGLAAQTAKDLDTPIATVDRILQSTQTQSFVDPKLQRLAGQAQQLGQFFKQLQDYIAGFDPSGRARAGDGDDNAFQRRQNLLNSNLDFSEWMPRSELLARLTEIVNRGEAVTRKPGTAQGLEPQATEIVSGARNLDDMAAAIEKLQHLLARRGNDPNNAVASALLQRLRHYEEVYLEAQKGHAITVNLSAIGMNSLTEQNEALSSLHDELLWYLLPQVLGTTEKRNPGETIRDYLNRIAISARDKSDWGLLGRAIETKQSLNMDFNSNSSDRLALQSFLAGINLERARQYGMAVGSFEAALKTGSQLIKPEIIGDYLEGIRKDHPQEFQEGLQISLNPPNPRGFAGPYPYLFPRVSPTQAPAPATVLPNPGGSPVPKPPVAVEPAKSTDKP